MKSLYVFLLVLYCPCLFGQTPSGLAELSYEYVLPQTYSPIRTLEGYQNHFATALQSPFFRLGKGLYGRTFLGYGFLHPASEFQAKEAVDFSCKKYVQPNPVCTVTEERIDHIQPASFFHEAEESKETKSLREKVYEYLFIALRVNGLNPDKKPECISSEHLQNLKSLPHGVYPVNNRSLSDSIEQIDLGLEDISLLNKYGAVEFSFSLENILRDIIYFDFLKRRLASTSSDRIGFEIYNEKKILLLNSSLPLRSMTDVQSRKVMEIVYRLLGDGDPESGEILFSETDIGYAKGWQAFAEKLQDKVIAEASLRESLINALRSVRSQSVTVAERDLDRLCNLQTSDLVKYYPNAVRQLLIDSSPNKHGIEEMLCRVSSFQKEIQVSRKSRSALVCKLTDMNKTEDENFIHISPRRYLKISIPKDESKPVDINMKLTFAIAADNFIGHNFQNEFLKTLKTWEDKVNNYYNDQVLMFEEKHSGKKLSRSLKFNFSLEPVSPENAIIKVYECVDNTTDKTCLQIIEDNYQACLRRPSGNSQDSRLRCESRKEKLLASYRAGNFDELPRRWNSAAFTPDISDKALVHEVGHHFGLHDEYQKDMFTSMASDNSLMATGDDLQERHFQEMVFKYLECL